MAFGVRPDARKIKYWSLITIWFVAALIAHWKLFRRHFFFANKAYRIVNSFHLTSINLEMTDRIAVQRKQSKGKGNFSLDFPKKKSTPKRDNHWKLMSSFRCCRCRDLFVFSFVWPKVKKQEQRRKKWRYHHAAGRCIWKQSKICGWHNPFSSALHCLRAQNALFGTCDIRISNHAEDATSGIGRATDTNKIITHNGPTMTV